jgi:hypothetical protein
MATIPGGMSEQFFSNFTHAFLEWAPAQYLRQLKDPSPAVPRQRSVKEQNRGHPGLVDQNGRCPSSKNVPESGMRGWDGRSASSGASHHDHG